MKIAEVVSEKVTVMFRGIRVKFPCCWRQSVHALVAGGRVFTLIQNQPQRD
jgi:hypothetical protein